jgi:hypothetical protein
VNIERRLEQLESKGGSEEPLIVVSGAADVPSAEKLADLGVTGQRYRVMRLHGPDTFVALAPNGVADVLRQIDGKTRIIASSGRDI